MGVLIFKIHKIPRTPPLHTFCTIVQNVCKGVFGYSNARGVLVASDCGWAEGIGKRWVAIKMPAPSSDEDLVYY